MVNIEICMQLALKIDRDQKASEYQCWKFQNKIVQILQITVVFSSSEGQGHRQS